MPYAPAELQGLYITVKEAATREGVHAETLYRRVRAGLYQTRKVGNTWRVRVDADGMPELKR